MMSLRIIQNIAVQAPEPLVQTELNIEADLSHVQFNVNGYPKDYPIKFYPRR